MYNRYLRWQFGRVLCTSMLHDVPIFYIMDKKSWICPIHCRRFLLYLFIHIYKQTSRDWSWIAFHNTFQSVSSPLYQLQSFTNVLCLGLHNDMILRNVWYSQLQAPLIMCGLCWRGSTEQKSNANTLFRLMSTSIDMVALPFHCQ